MKSAQLKLSPLGLLFWPNNRTHAHPSWTHASSSLHTHCRRQRWSDHGCKAESQKDACAGGIDTGGGGAAAPPGGRLL
jgi:hypothetical protein